MAAEYWPYAVRPVEMPPTFETKTFEDDTGLITTALETKVGRYSLARELAENVRSFSIVIELELVIEVTVLRSWTPEDVINTEELAENRRVSPVTTLDPWVTEAFDAPHFRDMKLMGSPVSNREVEFVSAI